MATAKPKKGAAEKPNPKRQAAKRQSVTPKVEDFITAYLAEPNGTRAYQTSHPGASVHTAAVEASRLLRNPEVARRINEARKAVSDKAQATREGVMGELWGIVRADPRDLVEFIVVNCRHCHGYGFAKQWIDEAEFDAACRIAEANHRAKLQELKSGEAPPSFVMPNDVGGFGFDPHGDPHPGCPHCMGNGDGRTVFKDTRFLSPEAASLFAGIKETKEGLEFKMHDKLGAAKEVAKLLGMYEKDNEQKGAGVARALASFVGGLHKRGAGQLPIAAPKPKQKKGWG